MVKNMNTKNGAAKPKQGVPYDVLDCPSVPPKNYPMEFPVMDVLNNWPIDSTKIPQNVHQGICIFDFSRKKNHQELRHQILTYRESEVPFVVRHDPHVVGTVERWHEENYMSNLLEGRTYRAEVSKSNHLMYWNINSGQTVVPKNFKRPTTMQPYTFKDWLKVANVTNIKNKDSHVYLRMDGCQKGHHCDSTHVRTGLSGMYKLSKIDHADFWYKEMPFFNPAHKDESALYVVDHTKQRGIQCRFGMKGIVAENHFDSDRNMVALLAGSRRYVLGHPSNCRNMALYDMKHPMERHSQVEWSKPNLTAFPQFPRTHVNEVILHAGDVLYLPTQWFHQIVSLNLNYQCNTRSGYTSHYEHLIRKCGFTYKPPT